MTCMLDTQLHRENMENMDMFRFSSLEKDNLIEQAVMTEGWIPYFVEKKIIKIIKENV